MYCTTQLQSTYVCIYYVVTKVPACVLYYVVTKVPTCVLYYVVTKVPTCVLYYVETGVGTRQIQISKICQKSENHNFKNPASRGPAY